MDEIFTLAVLVLGIGIYFKLDEIHKDIINKK